MVRNAMALVFRSMPLASQMALADFLAEGHFATHLRSMRDLYAERRGRFLAAAEQAGAGLLQAEIPDSGMNALVWLPAGLDDRETSRRAITAGVHCYSLSDYSVGPSPPGLILGFAGVSEGQLLPGLHRLADRIEALRRDGAGD